MARPRSFDEDQVLRTVRDRFWSTGYAGTRVDDILRDTGLGKGSLYGAFGDKHQLFLRAFQEYCDGLVRAVGSRLEGPDEGALERLSGQVREIAAAAASDTSLRGCLLANHGMEGLSPISEHWPELDTLASGRRGAVGPWGPWGRGAVGPWGRGAVGPCKANRQHATMTTVDSRDPAQCDDRQLPSGHPPLVRAGTGHAVRRGR
ncbi:MULTISPECIES: TetR/AcrR family transcriptional regulator [unclassified Streptomyces]|uniref:TetR/AcrR family transcriptional regulator n=1 Tax=unclassified Streptomyces TaxID=2593676 RepID=UPI0003784D87|nr:MULTISPECIES: TetR/AcrR family transcriptional regulator [unclassified Streptomyces]